MYEGLMPRVSPNVTTRSFKLLILLTKRVKKLLKSRIITDTLTMIDQDWLDILS